MSKDLDKIIREGDKVQDITTGEKGIVRAIVSKISVTVEFEKGYAIVVPLENLVKITDSSK